MPLVEVIRGEKTNDAAVAQTTALALAMGKTPIVVKDCPGFLVNRVLFPYFMGFMGLVQDGVDFKRIDKVMEAFGWPMGPAYLLDVIGLDTCVHALKVMAEGFPDRMSAPEGHALQIMFESKRFGQKNGNGFYTYKLDKKGRPQKLIDEQVTALLERCVSTKREVSDADILDRMMFPMIFEAIRCLEEEIVKTPTEVDMGVVYGLGFPPFRGGILRYADSVRPVNLVKKATEFKSLGAIYQPPQQLEELAQNGKAFYP